MLTTLLMNGRSSGIGLRQMKINKKMPHITFENLKSLKATNVPYAYTERDSMLYSLAVGMGRDPLDLNELNFVYERRDGLLTIPAQAVTVARHNLIYDIGLNVPKILHGEQKLTLHQTFPSAAEMLADHHVMNVFDKGAEKGLQIQTMTKVRLKDGTPLFDLQNLYFAKADGGIGSPDVKVKKNNPMPVRKPDITRSYPTFPWQALLYRLTGDRNVIHADPDIAKQMGFARPILQGSATLGIACREILSSVCNYKPSMITCLSTRFTSVVYPGDIIETDIWTESDGVRFRSRVPERNVVVLDHGICKFTVL